MEPSDRLGAPDLGSLGEFTDHHFALQLGNMIDEQHPVQVINLVLQAGCQQATRPAFAQGKHFLRNRQKTLALTIW